MFTIAGATGRVGSAVTRNLLADGAPVRVIVRDEQKGTRWAAAGAQVAVADLSDRSALTAALDGSRGAFVLLPFDVTAEDVRAQERAQVAAIAGAVCDSGVRHVAMLSSIGADLAEGTGPIVGLHHIEEALRGTGATISAIRSSHFQEKVSDLLDAARHEGLYPVLADSADEPIPMVATRDIGRTVADVLQAPPTTSEVVDVTGPVYTERQVAQLLGAALGRDLEVVTVPQSGWVDTLVGTGLPPHVAELLAELAAADQRGLLVPRGDRIVTGPTPLEATLETLVGVPA
ncbi:NmrA family NAD(P)-binding protein [Nitriliruptor alkaliphilus]|uniref:NmrA family NAD(P)-binding protein n=1 Tax=Nitriliruptor alkaliphilus TaxID=427918 RepID=UPI000695D5E5|nr:NmrA family NAD(P)-binding protein [Nitriliruptor alkaliphilus]